MTNMAQDSQEKKESLRERKREREKEREGEKYREQEEFKISSIVLAFNIYILCILKRKF